MDNIRPEIRTFVLGTIGISTATWHIAFNFGAYRTVFFRNTFTVWVTVTTILLVLLLVPERDIPVPRWGKLLMLIPTLGVILVPVSSNMAKGGIAEGLTIILGGVALLICLPYAIYVAINVVNADLLELPDTRLKIYLVIIVLLVGLTGYGVGANNHLFMTCGDFKIAGDDTPANCRPGPPAQF